jgi:hypothetical protein
MATVTKASVSNAILDRMAWTSTRVILRHNTGRLHDY